MKLVGLDAPNVLLELTLPLLVIPVPPAELENILTQLKLAVLVKNLFETGLFTPFF